MLLGDMGADVIKIEPRRVGDMIRNTQPHVEGESANYIAINRNKRSIAIDLKQPEGRDIVLKLAETADLVLENFRPGVMEARPRHRAHSQGEPRDRLRLGLRLRPDRAAARPLPPSI